MRKGIRGSLSAIAIAALCGVLLGALIVDLAVAKGKRGKIIAAPRFEVPGNILAPLPHTGFAAIEGRLGIRDCFTSVWSDGKEVKCPAAVLRACTENRQIRIRGDYSILQFATTGTGGSLSATVPFPGDYEELWLHVGQKRAQTRRLRITCFPFSESIAISEPNP
jgi:hypothetical protein